MKFQFKIEKILLEKLLFIQQKSWIITVLVFLIVLVSAVIIWWNCILNPQPSETALKNILNTEAEYQRRTEVIKKNHQELKERIDKFNDPQSNLLEGKTYFKVSEETIQMIQEYNPEPETYNPDLVN